MKKKSLFYSAAWLVCITLFNILAFVFAKEIYGNEKFGAAFWTGYVFITIAFIGNLICSIIALNSEKKRLLFYRLSLISVSYCGLIIILVIGTLCMTVPFFPVWLGVALCMIALAINVIALIKAFAAVEIVSGIDDKNMSQTVFMKGLSSKAHELVKTAQTEYLKKEAQKVYDAIKYSDPVSNTDLEGINLELKDQFAAFSDAVSLNDEELARACSESLMTSIVKRNELSKKMKCRDM